ncbi:MAG: TetR/AcrR family transcriptional regulator [Alphaproteobacteria bacterium]|nr:TetR/AcrR family transcriptional regulator [Alphaproteobacteria bacterium]
MPRPRWSRLDPAQQARILDAAAEEFAAAGFHEASLNRILAEAGLSKGAAYYYFDDKEDLFLTLVEARVGALVREAAAGALPEADFWGWVERLSWGVFGGLAQDPKSWALARELYAMLPGGRSPRVAEAWAQVSAWTERLLERGQALGEVREDLPLSLLSALTLGLGEALDRWALDAVPDPEAAEAEMGPVMAASMDLFRRLLAPGKG